MGIQTPNGFNLDNSGKRIVVDPVTRIEGHMRVEVNVDVNNVIRNAVSTGTMWRGIEVILKNRDPRDAWAFTERICGVCTGTHALTSVRAVENALDITIPENANSIRNLMQLALQVHDHVVHFYHLHALDWVDVVSALSGDFDARAVDLELAAVVARLLQGPANPSQEVLRVGAVGALQERLLGQQGLQAAARGQSDGGRALSGGARFSEGDRQDPHHLRRQESASELARGRRALSDQRRRHRRGRCHQHRAPEPDLVDHRSPDRVQRAGLPARRGGDRFVLQRTGSTAAVFPARAYSLMATCRNTPTTTPPRA